MTTITVGRECQLRSSSIIWRVITLKPDDRTGINLAPGQSAWVWECGWIAPILLFAVPVLVANREGQLVREVLGIDWGRPTHTSNRATLVANQ